MWRKISGLSSRIWHDLSFVIWSAHATHKQPTTCGDRTRSRHDSCGSFTPKNQDFRGQATCQEQRHCLETIHHWRRGDHRCRWHHRERNCIRVQQPPKSKINHYDRGQLQQKTSWNRQITLSNRPMLILELSSWKNRWGYRTIQVTWRPSISTSTIACSRRLDGVQRPCVIVPIFWTHHQSSQSTNHPEKRRHLNSRSIGRKKRTSDSPCCLS